MIDVNRKGEVWVFAEQHGGKIEDTPLELMSKARRLADTLGVKLAAAVLGDKVKPLAKKLVRHGADKVYLAEHPLLGQYQTNSYAKALRCDYRGSRFGASDRQRDQGRADRGLHGFADRRSYHRQGQESP